MSRLLVAGSVNMDMTIFSERMPIGGETISGSSFLLSPGGKGANQAVAAARMGSQTTFTGCVGDDVFGRELVRSLTSHGIDTSSVKLLSDESTGVASITVVGGDNRIILYSGANGRFLCDGSFEGLVKQCDALLLQLEIPLQSVLDAVDIAAKHNKPVFLTPAPAARLPLSLYPKIYCLLPNESETGLLLGRTLTSDDDILLALRRFRELGVEEPVITLGDRGIGCFVNGEPRVTPAHRVDPVDTTAAGDTFTGALATALMSGRKMADSVDFAQRAAAICVTRKGAQNAIPSLSEVEAAGSIV